MSASDFFKDKDKLKATLEVVAEKAIQSQREKYMTTEQENKYLRQVLVDLWSFFGEEKNADDYIHDLDQIRGKVFNNLVKEKELNEISIAIRLADDAKYEELKKLMAEHYPPMKLTDR